MHEPTGFLYRFGASSPELGPPGVTLRQGLSASGLSRGDLKRSGDVRQRSEAGSIALGNLGRQCCTCSKGTPWEGQEAGAIRPPTPAGHWFREVTRSVNPLALLACPRMPVLWRPENVLQQRELVYQATCHTDLPIHMPVIREQLTSTS